MPSFSVGGDSRRRRVVSLIDKEYLCSIRVCFNVHTVCFGLTQQVDKLQGRAGVSLSFGRWYNVNQTSPSRLYRIARPPKTWI